MQSRSRRRLLHRGALVACAALAWALALASPLVAQSERSTVVRVLRESPDFRARVRAALALGSGADREATPHLVRALSDGNPAVRAAAATGLGRLADPNARTPLRGALSDSSPVVRLEAERALRRIDSLSPPPPATAALRNTMGPPGVYPPIEVVPQARDIAWPSVRYVVVLGEMTNRSSFTEPTLGQLLQEEVSRNLRVMRGVAVLHAGNEPPDAAQEIRRRRLPQLRLEGSLNRVDRRAERSQLLVRCEVSLMLMDEPGRNLRGVLNGAATGAQPPRGPRADQERRLAHQALTGAVRSAMSGASQAIASAGRN